MKYILGMVILQVTLSMRDALSSSFLRMCTFFLRIAPEHT